MEKSFEQIWAELEEKGMIIDTEKSETFLLLSDAKIFQRRKQKEGFKTKLVHYLGVLNPKREVFYWK